MPEPVVVVERHDQVALLRLNRPAARNALNAELAQAAIDAVDANQDAGAIVITGTDPAFCAGLDLRDLGVPTLKDLPHFTAAVAASQVPTIAAVNGPAVTGGFELALACDFMIASERARFADTHLRVGVYPGPVLVDLPRRVGPAWARQMSLTSDFVDAETALRIGLVNQVVATPTSCRTASTWRRRSPSSRATWSSRCARTGTSPTACRCTRPTPRTAGSPASGPARLDGGRAGQPPPGRHRPRPPPARRLIVPHDESVEPPIYCAGGRGGPMDEVLTDPLTDATVRPLGIHHVSINVDDLAVALAPFYVDVLGFSERADRPDFPGTPGAWLDVGGQQVHLIVGEVPDALGQHYAVLVADIDLTVTRLREQGVRVSDPVEVGTGLQSFTRDPVRQHG